MLLRQKFIISSCAWMLSLLGLIIFIIMPVITDILRTNQIIAKERRELEERYEKGLSLRALRNQLAQVDEGLKKIAILILGKENQLEFVTTLEQIASKHHVAYELSLNNFETNLNTAKQDVVPVLLTISLEGEYSRLLSAIHDYEQTPFLLRVTNLDMQTSSDGANTDLKAVLQLESYWRK